MGMFKKLKQFSGSVDKNLLKNGLLGRGTILDVKQTNAKRRSALLVVNRNADLDQRPDLPEVDGERLSPLHSKRWVWSRRQPLSGGQAFGNLGS